VADPPLTRDDVLAARETIGDRVHRTPTFSSATLARTVGVERAYLKAELFQRTGSFKPRGVLNKLSWLSPEERSRGVITWSAGNHAQAVAYASALEGLDCVVVMSRHANPSKVAATRGYGAAVDLEAGNHSASYDRLLELIDETGKAFIHPFDDPLVIAGHGTVGLELVEDVPTVNTIVVPVGGGGLISGIALAADGCRVIGVEPEGSTALSSGLAAGHSVTVESKTIADGLGPPFAGELCIEICRRRVEPIVLVSELEIAEAMRFLYARAKLACEPSGAAAAAALLAGKIDLDPGETVGVVVSGGNADPKIAAAILAGDL
jgi:threonine dehydratase